LDLIERAVDDRFGNRLLARLHDHVHELGQVDRAELRVGQDLAFGNFATTWHGSLPFRVSVGAPHHLRAPRRVIKALHLLAGATTAPAWGSAAVRRRKSRARRTPAASGLPAFGLARTLKALRPSSDALRRTSSATACGL